MIDLCGECHAVLLLADVESELDVVHSLRAGVRGYLMRGSSRSRLVDGVRLLATDGAAALDPTTTRHLLQFISQAAEEPTRTLLDVLTDRQRAVALLAADGLNNQEIAQNLYLSQATVKSHLAAILRRLGLRSRIQLVVMINDDRRVQPAGQSSAR